MISQDSNSVLSMTAHYQGEHFQPDMIKTHAALDVIGKGWNDIVAQINGQFTDADRYRALLAFAMLGQEGKGDAARFDAINAILQDYDEHNGLTDGPRTPEEFRASSDLVIRALIETETAPGAAT